MVVNDWEAAISADLLIYDPLAWATVGVLFATVTPLMVGLTLVYLVPL